MRSVNGDPSEPLINGASVVIVMEDDLLQATSMSMLVVNTTMNGSHSYSCRAELIVAPAPENITAENQTMISVVGELKKLIFVVSIIMHYAVCLFHTINYQGLPLQLN